MKYGVTAECYITEKERISLKSKQKVVRKHVITDLMRGLYEIREYKNYFQRAVS